MKKSTHRQVGSPHVCDWIDVCLDLHNDLASRDRVDNVSVKPVRHVRAGDFKQRLHERALVTSDELCDIINAPMKRYPAVIGGAV
jgi:hypothetical protein